MSVYLTVKIDIEGIGYNLLNTRYSIKQQFVCGSNCKGELVKIGDNIQNICYFRDGKNCFWIFLSEN